MLFKELSLIEPLLRALEAEGYEQPTPIQEQAIPIVLARRDLLGCAQTGTGKTAAFALPMLQILHQTKSPAAGGKTRPIRALILTPTRELAIQIGESFDAYGKNVPVRNLVIFGGVGQTPQTDALRRGTDVLIATPGRLLDLMNQGYISLRDIEIFVLDEADRMLDMGFIHDVKKVIAKLPTQRQTLFFSATMPDEISSLANSILTDPLRVEVTPVSSTAEKVEQAVYFVEKQNKRHLLVHLLKDQSIRSALVFTRTKHGANKVAADISKSGIFAEAIHGNKSQSARQAALSNFKSGRTRVLVATDIAARGIDIDELSHVVNYELPNIPETYVHRIGRTGRAGMSGIALSFCEAEELPYLKDIQKLTGQLVPVVTEHPYAADLAAPGLPQPQQRKEKGGQKPPQIQKVRPQQRPDMIPLPDRRPDTVRLDQQPRNDQRPNNGGNRQHQQPQPAEKQPQQPQPRPNNGGQNRSEQRPQRDQRDNNAQRDRQPQQGRPQGGQQQSSRPNREGNTPKPQPQRPQPPKPEQKPKPTDVASAMRNRFASILEVSAIEKQERPPKPKPDYRDRDRDNRNGGNNNSGGNRNGGGGNFNRNNRGGGGRGR